MEEWKLTRRTHFVFFLEPWIRLTLSVKFKKMEDRALFELHLNLPKEFEQVFSDIIKWTTVICTRQILSRITGSSSISGWPGVFRLILFVSIGFSAYYLVINKLIRLHFGTRIGENDTLSSLLQRLRRWLKERIWFYSDSSISLHPPSFP